MVAELDRYIVGQADAKKAVALSLSTVAVAYSLTMKGNRWRRFKLPPKLRDEVIPKNILMIGPTGVSRFHFRRSYSKDYLSI